MNVEVYVGLYHKPETEISCPDPTQLPATLHCHADEMAVRLHQAADITARLLRDGWKVEQTLYELLFWNPAIRSVHEAEARLQSLGIDPGACSIEEGENEGEADFDFCVSSMENG